MRCLSLPRKVQNHGPAARRDVRGIRRRLLPQIVHLAIVIDECCRNAADLDRETATNLVLQSAEATLRRLTENEEVRAEACALMQDILAARRAN